MVNYKASDLLADGKFSDDGIGLWKGFSNGTEKKHTHEFIEMTYIYSGEGTHIINDVSYPVSRGDFLLVNLNQTHAFISEGDLEYCNILVFPEFVSEELINSENAMDMLALSTFEDFSGDADKATPLIRFRGINQTDAEHLIDEMLVEYTERKTGYRSALKALLTVILIKAFRQMWSSDNIGVLKQMGQMTPEILRYVEENCFEKISVASMARKCFYNPSYFSRMFKECYGQNITDFIQEKRIFHAKKLLVSTNMSVGDICLHVGYCDKKQFYNIFRKYTGKTPGEYRRNADQSENE